MNWYKLAKLELQLRKTAGWKESILATLLSIMSSIAIPYEAHAIRKFLDERHIDPKQQQEIVSTVNQLTHQNKNLDDLNINDIGSALDNAGKTKPFKPFNPKQFENMFDPQPQQPQQANIAEAGELDIQEVKDSIKKHEGKNNRVYLDPSGKNWNIGYGYNLNKSNAPSVIKSLGANYRAILSGRQSLNDVQVEKLLDISIQEAINTAKSFAPNYNQLPSKAKLVLVDMAFMGRGNLHSFSGLKSALIWDDYDKAADEMLNSLWAEQVGDRAIELANIMRSVAML